MYRIGCAAGTVSDSAISTGWHFLLQPVSFLWRIWFHPNDFSFSWCRYVRAPEPCQKLAIRTQIRRWADAAVVEKALICRGSVWLPISSVRLRGRHAPLIWLLLWLGRVQMRMQLCLYLCCLAAAPGLLSTINLPLFSIDANFQGIDKM